MFKRRTEFTVGVFMLAGIAALIYLSITLGNINIFGSRYFGVTALFDSITGLKVGANVEIAGVRVGKVDRIELSEDMALVNMEILNAVNLSDDSIVSIRTKGIIGEKFIKISPGGSEEFVEDGGTIVDTESAISLEELISKYIFEK